MTTQPTESADAAASDAPGLTPKLRRLALTGLPRMYRPDEQTFVFRLRREGPGVVSEGLSPRYTAITLIGLAAVGPEAARRVLGQAPEAVCGRLARNAATSPNLGDVALTLWALCAQRYGDREAVRRRLRELDPASGAHPTVEVAWSLTALCADSVAEAAETRQRLAQRLTESARPAGVFPHRLGSDGGMRGHVACFADMVYPIQALSRHHLQTGDRLALDAALRAGELICALQGDAGQWWWHYDWRTGRVVEPYPVYAVHQDSMAPMALQCLQKASGRDFQGPIERGLEWLARSPELDGGSLIDDAEGLIWRKVARREPGKLARYLQAAASRAHPALRVPGLDVVLPPRAIDYEDRPYHLGWVLHAWPEAGRSADV